MKREYEILMAAEEFQLSRMLLAPDECTISFIAGAEWADKQKRVVRSEQRILKAAGEFTATKDFLTESTCKRAFLAGAEWANEHTIK